MIRRRSGSSAVVPAPTRPHRRESDTLASASARLERCYALERAGRYRDALAEARRATHVLAEPAGFTTADIEILRVEADIADGTLLRTIGDISASISRLRATVRLSSQRLGPTHHQTAAAHNALGISYKFAGELSAAHREYTRALAILQTHGGPPRFLANVLHDLGGLDHELGHSQSGIAWAEAGLSARESDPDADPIEVAADLAALGALYEQAGRLDDAERVLVTALDDIETLLGPDHLEVATVCSVLAVVVARRGRWADAERLFDRALTIKRRALGSNHPDIAATMSNFGVLLFETGRRDEGRRLVGEAERILRAHVRPDHPRLLAVHAAQHHLDRS